MSAFQHIVNVSGGKDSDCCYCLAVARGKPFRAVMFDTGHEHDWTYEHVARLPERTGGPPVEILKRDFTAALERRRTRLPDQWRAAGVSEALISRALELLHPTGNPYFDMVMSKGMFAKTTGKFCTEVLKIEPANQMVVKPLLAAGVTVIQWLGIRADESRNRADTTRHPRFERSRGWRHDNGASPALGIYRPILGWTLEDVIACHQRFDLPMNPLYAEGFKRVGCFPCINERKDSMAIIAKRFPEVIEKLRRWEALATEVNVSRKDGLEDICTFFPAGTVPNMVRNTIDDVAMWSLTSRGGKQFNMFAGLEDIRHVACSTAGWCEAA